VSQLQRILDLARGEIGVAESPAGSNRVKYNTAYYGWEISGASYPWCCVFLWWLFYEAGLSHLFYDGGKTASCGTLNTFARQNGQLVSAGYRSGDLLFLRFSGTAVQHIGLIERVNSDGTLTTIEGNTGMDSDANGGMVMRRVRPISCAAGAFRPDYEEENMTQEQFDTMMDAWLREQAEKAPSDFSAEARDWGENAGIILGDAKGNRQYKSFCTREQMLVFLDRFSKLTGR